MRYAFVMGSNGPDDLDPLRFAALDAKRIRERLALPDCGFEVAAPGADADADEAVKQLRTVALACHPDDDLVCYFSGHGLIDRGELFLIWHHSRRDQLLSTSIAAADVMKALKFSPARNKLLILDCCHAGNVVHMLGLKGAVSAAEAPVEETLQQPDNFLVLMASDRLERARELGELTGSFLTVALLQALEYVSGEADADDDGRISTRDLEQWLTQKAEDYNRQALPDRTVPYPYFFGQRKGEFYLTLGEPERPSYEWKWPDGSVMIVLPVTPKRLRQLGVCTNADVGDDRLLAIAKHPVTNAQYRRFVEKTGWPEPIGEKFVSGTGWEGPFYPWREPGFDDPDQPVVCVSYQDAQRYCKWADSKTPSNRHRRFMAKLPTSTEWDFVAFGTPYPATNPRAWLKHPTRVISDLHTPVTIDRSGARADRWGVCDLIGNVWQWCDQHEELMFMLMYHPHYGAKELRGGGFLDNLGRIPPVIQTGSLRDGTDTKHSDLGFRLAAYVPISSLPREARLRMGL